MRKSSLWNPVVLFLQTLVILFASALLWLFGPPPPGMSEDRYVGGIGAAIGLVSLLILGVMLCAR